LAEARITLIRASPAGWKRLPRLTQLNADPSELALVFECLDF
jgi:hypothetical protein